jgi:hypothetical protein
MDNELNYWESYYKAHQDPGDESPFARFVAPFLVENSNLIELWCGNGRDSLFFASLGVNVIAFDQCENEVSYLNDKYSSSKLSFEAGDFTNIGMRSSSNFIYSRFTLHSVSEEKEINTLKWSSQNLEKGGLFFIEIRSVKDELYGEGSPKGKNEFVTDHYRRFVSYTEFIERIENTGLTILYKVEGKGLAPYKDEDPVVIRVIAQK